MNVLGKSGYVTYILLMDNKTKIPNDSKLSVVMQKYYNVIKLYLFSTKINKLEILISERYE